MKVIAKTSVTNKGRLYEKDASLELPDDKASNMIAKGFVAAAVAEKKTDKAKSNKNSNASE